MATTSTLDRTTGVAIPSPGMAIPSPPRALDAVRREFRRSRGEASRSRWTTRTIRERLPRVSLDEALEILLTWRYDTGRFESGAVAWQARLAGYAPRLSLEESAVAVDALSELGGCNPELGAYSLRALCRRHGLEDVARVLDGWLEERESYGGL
jgi:hypothetical protein